MKASAACFGVRRNRHFAFLLLLVLSCGIPRPTRCESTDQDGEHGVSRQRLEEMREIARAMKFVAGKTATATPLALGADPVLRFSVPTRQSDDAALWIVGTNGRPAALMALERYEVFWSHELVSLSTGPISATTSDAWRWVPKEPGINLQRFPESLPVGNLEAARLRQMKRLAQRFKVTTKSQGERYILRLMASPVYRYADPDAGIMDGAIFIFANGTNPSAVCLVECHDRGVGEARWQYAFASLCASESSAQLNEQVVWTKSQTRRQRTPTRYTIVQIPSPEQRRRDKAAKE